MSDDKFDPKEWDAIPVILPAEQTIWVSFESTCVATDIHRAVLHAVRPVILQFIEIPFPETTYKGLWNVIGTEASLHIVAVLEQAVKIYVKKHCSTEASLMSFSQQLDLLKKSLSLEYYWELQVILAERNEHVHDIWSGGLDFNSIRDIIFCTLMQLGFVPDGVLSAPMSHRDDEYHE